MTVRGYDDSTLIHVFTRAAVSTNSQAPVVVRRRCVTTIRATRASSTFYCMHAHSLQYWRRHVRSCLRIGRLVTLLLSTDPECHASVMGMHAFPLILLRISHTPHALPPRRLAFSCFVAVQQRSKRSLSFPQPRPCFSQHLRL